MNGYVEAGYVVGLGTLAGYAVSLVVRERAARRRVVDVPTGAPLASGPSGVRDLGVRDPGDPAPAGGGGPARAPGPGPLPSSGDGR